MLLALLGDALLAGTASSSFKDAWGSAHAERVWLIQITLASPSPLALRLATRGGFTPDGNYWQECITRIAPTRDGGRYLDSGPNLSSFDFDVDNREIAESAGVSLASLFSTYVFQGATVELYLWERTLTSFADAYRRFVGVLNRPQLRDSMVVTLYALQDRSWNQPLLRTRITETGFPEATEASLGAYLGEARGDWRTAPMRTPFPSNFALKRYHEDVGGQEPAVQGIITDAGAGTLPVRALFVGHEVSEINTDAGTRASLEGGNQFRGMIERTLVTAINGSTGSGVSIPEDSLRAFYPVIPIDVRATGIYKNTALNPKYALDPLNEQSFATVDPDAGFGRLQLMLPNLASLGEIQTVDQQILYRTQNASGNCTMSPVRVSNDERGTPAITIPASTTPTVARGSYLPVVWWSRNWEFGNVPDSGVTPEFDLLATAPAGQKLYVYGMALTVYYKPALVLIQRTVNIIPQSIIDRIRIGSPDFLQPFRRVESTLYEFRSPVRFNFVGPLDDGSGSWTGSPGILKERHTDIVREYLSIRGGLDKNADFEMGADQLGSFLDARNALETMEGSQFTASTFDNSQIRLADFISRMGEEALCQFELDPASGKWHCLPWVRQPNVSYGTLYRNDFESLEVELQSDTEVAQAIDIDYGFSPATGRHLWKTILDKDNSEQGFLEGTAGDQRLLVQLGVNDTLKFTTGAGTKTAVFTPNEYLSGLALAQEIQTRMTLADAASWLVGYGTAIKTGFNDQISVIVGGTTYTATLREYEYTPQSLAREAEGQLNAAGTGLAWTVTYSRTTRKFTIAASGAFTLVLTNLPRQALAVMGYAIGTNLTDSSSPFSITAAKERYQEFFWVSTTNALGILYWTATTVSGTTCQFLIGSVDTTDPIVGQWNASRRRGVRQSRAAASALRYGERDPSRLKSVSIRVYSVAADRNHREFDFRVVPKVRINGISRRLPDLKRGHTLQLDPELDAWRPYIAPESNGSHAGRVYRVTEVTQHNGPADASAHFVAYEVDAAAPAAAAPAGGSSAFVAYNNNSDETFVQKLNASGVGVWGSGIQVSNSESGIVAVNVVVIPDGTGGCFVAFLNRTSSLDHVRAVRLNSDGTVATGWSIGGTVVSNDATAGNSKRLVAMCLDGLGGIIVTWADRRTGGGSGNFEVWAQRLNGAGVAQWTANGVKLSDTTWNAQTTQIRPDGTGGAFVAWTTSSAGSDFARCVRVSSTGGFPAGWALNGISLNGAGVANMSASISMCTDAAGGVYVLWREGVSSAGVKLSRVKPDGTVYSGFPTASLDSAATTSIFPPVGVVPDLSGGALCVWAQGNIAPSSTSSVAVQRVGPTGSLLLAAGGVRISADRAGNEHLQNIRVSPDGDGGVIVTGYTFMGSSGSDVWAQRATLAGTKLWGADGLVVAANTGNGEQTLPDVVGIGAGVGWIVWADGRILDSGAFKDVFAQLVSGAGTALLTANGVLVADIANATAVSVGHPTTAPP